ncbi:lipopolysaccharide transport periplasmic protein LptA [Salmonella enterica]|nr:lipopolysaccharide transport periplasmic protein LptA [Salmonella enterica]EJF5594645.1 lipopolysaccharide transport periplasmic protein LptA [Salmonella enterica]EJF5825810.1 lipopolysaccharide transport periplasmic protein LptA [Salmonella enterica]EJF5844522.1 lipopolysaccharide transport periplasmic protein LptA [Salmonella enterica]EJF5916999.1 lipopolysaccharide transport periplasmic protein LptA [Salmonella enterica]
MKGYITILFFITGSVNASNTITNNYTIDSDNQLILSNGNIKAIGNVHVVSGDMTIDAGEAIYHRENLKDTYITATGNPIKYNGITEDSKPFSGISKKLKYTPETGEVILTGEAFVQQNGNFLSAEVITYNINTKKMIASAPPGKKRVRSVIYPKRVK